MQWRMDDRLMQHQEGYLGMEEIRKIRAECDVPYLTPADNNVRFLFCTVRINGKQKHLNSELLQLTKF